MSLNFADCTNDCNLVSYFEDSENNYSDLPTLTRCMITLACTCIFYTLLLFFIEYRVLATLKIKLKKVLAMKKDTTSNSEILLPIVDENDVMLIDRLSKVVSSIPTDENVIFELKRRECFGILGPAGAGKTNILQTLSNQVCESFFNKPSFINTNQVIILLFV